MTAILIGEKVLDSCSVRLYLHVLCKADVVRNIILLVSCVNLVDDDDNEDYHNDVGKANQ